MARLFRSHWRWIVASGSIAALLIVVLRLQSADTVSEYYITANSGYGRITLISARSGAQVKARIPGIGAISSVALFREYLVLCSSYSDADPSGPDPARGLWVLSLLDGTTSRCNESMLSGPVYMCTVLDGALWFLEGSKLWSTTDLERFELRHEDVRAAVAVSPSTIVVQDTSGTLSWIRVKMGMIERGALGKADPGSTMDTMFGSYAFFNNWSVKHLPVPELDQIQSPLPSARDPSWAFRAFFDTRYKTWITVRNSVGRIYSFSRVSVEKDTEEAFTVRRNRIESVVQISEREFETIARITSAWTVK